MQDRGPGTFAVSIIVVVIATVFVAARFFTRIWLVRSVKQDDWWILAALLLAIGFSASVCTGVHYGLGLHRSDIPAAHFPSLRKAQYAFAVLYNPSLMVTKTSIIIFYLSVMSKDADPLFKYSNWLCLAVVNIAGLALTFLNIFQCSPVRAGYAYPTPANASCTDIVTLYLSSAPVNIITDIAILLLPMPILTGMRLPRKQKIILVVTFSFGIFVAVVDVIRIAYLQQASRNRLSLAGNGTGQTRVVEDNDFSWYASLSFMWSAVEVNLGIVCACVPSLKPLFLRFLPSFIKDAGDPNSPGGSHDGDTVKSDSFKGRGDVSMVNNPAAFRRPTIPEYTGADEGDDMGFLNFLAGSETEGPNLRRTDTINTQRSAVSNFDFVRFSKSENMLKLSNRESVWPIAVVTVIFFLWGFAYGLLATLNSQFQRVVNLTTGQASGLHAAYFGGYLLGPLTLGRVILKRYGFKATMMVGLWVYGCGTLVFWPSAVLTSYTAFIISNVIVGFGLSCLEIAANPFIALCGPLEYAEARLNLSQAFQGVGTVLSPLLARKVLFKNVLDAPSLVNVQWAYLGIALFVFLLAAIFYYIRLPEASDDDLQALADRRSAVYRTRVGPFQVVWVTLALGVFSQWCYVGGQESIGSITQPLSQLPRSGTSLAPPDFQSVGQTVFAVGRFLSAFLNYVMKPRWILLGLYVGLIILCAIQMSLNGTAGAVVQMFIYLFESGIFSIIFAMSMRGLGAHTKTGAALMTAAISGGAPLPVIQWVVARGHGLRYSYCVPLAAFAFSAIFPIYLNLVPAARNHVDPIHEHRTQRRLNRQHGIVATPDAVEKQFGLAGIMARRRKHASPRNSPTVEHVEVGRSVAIDDTGPPTIPRGDAEIPEMLSPVQLRPPAAQVGELAPWPTGEDGQSSHSSSGSDDADPNVITQLRSDMPWTAKDFGYDDYHATLRSI